MTDPATPPPWGDHPAPSEGETSQIVIGPLTLWFRRVKNELWMTLHRSDNGSSDPTPPPDVEWGRWALGDIPVTIRLRPVLPDRLLVVKPDLTFTLLKRARARVYARVPVWVHVSTVDRRNEVNHLTDVPTVVLSDTWWGDFNEGELAYWLPTKARRELQDAHFESHMAIAVLQLTNQSQDDLPVEKLALRVEHLSIFETEGRLWAEEVKVDYRGESEGSDIRMDDNPPEEATGAREISPARAQTRGFRARTFTRLKALSGFGG